VARLNYDTFPKSGTMWLGNCLSLSFPKEEIFFGSHRITTLRKKENVITVLRNPKDTISSYIVFFDNLNLCMGCRGYHTFNKVEDIFEWYCRFLKGMIDNYNRIYVVDFEKLTKNPYEVMVSYSKYFNLSKPCLITEQQVKEKTFKTNPENMPSPLTKQRIHINKIVESNTSLNYAQKLYESIYSNFSI